MHSRVEGAKNSFWSVLRELFILVIKSNEPKMIATALEKGVLV